ncbi:RcnB family protein [Comamonas serinivorans]|nr:RcnB family protein [Comamonas serinivorans]
MSLNTVRMAVTLALAAMLGTTAAQAHAQDRGRSAIVLTPVLVQADRLKPVDHRPGRVVAAHGVRTGDRLTRGQLARAVTLDWRRQGLRAPGRDQQWLRLDRQRVLISKASGRVLRVA